MKTVPIPDGETIREMWLQYLNYLEKAGAVPTNDSAEVCKANFYAGATAILAMLDHNEFISQCSYRFYKKFMEMREEIRRETQRYTEQVQ